MLLEARNDTLIGALSAIRGAISKAHTIPVLECVLITVRPSGVVLTATDMMLRAEIRIEADRTQEGGVAVPLGALLEALKSQPRDRTVSVGIEDKTGRVTVRSGKFSSSLSAYEPDDFPSLAGAVGQEKAIGIVLPQSRLVRLLKTVRFAASTEETRYYLCGVYLHPVDGPDGVAMIRTVATDGHRLAWCQDVPEKMASAPDPVILPTRLVTEMLAHLDDKSEENVTLEIWGRRVGIWIGNYYLTSTVIDGTYPEYARVIPADHPNTARMPARALEHCVQAASSVIQERSKPVKMTFADMLTVASQDERGSAVDVMEEGYSLRGRRTEIGFQARYVLDVLQHVAETAEFHLHNETAPAVVRDVDDANKLFVVMPMRV